MKLNGVFIPAITPFEDDELLSVCKLEYNIEKWNRTQVGGYMCLGSNGEFRMLDDEESLEVIRAFIRCKGEDKMLIAGAGRESLYHTLKFIDRIQKEPKGPDIISVLTPHYFRNAMTDKALVEYYTKIADFSIYPVMMYCAPGFANGVCISCEVLKELADHPNICGIKDTSSDMMLSYMEAVGDRKDFQVMAGSVNTLYLCLQSGGEAAVLSAANYYPQECAELITIWNKEGEGSFLTAYEDLKEKIRKTGGIGGVAGVKCCMNQLGYQAGIPRNPLMPLPEEKVFMIRQALKCEKEL